jgi:NAD(P)-dependent dehydrogenase (short-subunit alcohol dehydrogenase family)
MATDQSTVYVVTGANRGIGLGLVTSLLSRPHTVIIGTVRSAQAHKQLADAAESLPKGDGSTLYIAQVDYSTVPGPEAIRKSIDEATAGEITHVDVLICNAGYADSMRPVLETTAAQMREHFDINTIGPLMTFQALWPYMQQDARSRKDNTTAAAAAAAAAAAVPAKFILISSSVGSIGMMEPLPGGAYGPSKAAANWIAKAIHEQYSEQGIVSVAIHPGFIATGMGRGACESWKLPVEMAADTVENSVRGLLEVIGGATKEGVSGKFVTQKGQELGW